MGCGWYSGEIISWHISEASIFSVNVGLLNFTVDSKGSIVACDDPCAGMRYCMVLPLVSNKTFQPEKLRLGILDFCIFCPLVLRSDVLNTRNFPSIHFFSMVRND